MSFKASFRNVANVLQGWNEASGEDDHCSWRGVVCDNVTFSVVSLYVVLTLFLVMAAVYLVLLCLNVDCFSNLSNLNLGGEISAAVGDLKSLESL